MVFFTSDSHLGHWAINDYCNRGFSTVEDMDAALIEGWNSVVGPDDTVYHLGDFCLGDYPPVRKYFSKLNGKILVLSNSFHHDRYWLKKAERVQYGLTSMSKHPVHILPPIHNLEFPKYGDGTHPKTIVLCHFPIQTWDKKHYGSWHLHGHTHKQVQQSYPPELKINVAVDARSRRDWKPISLTWVANVLKEMEKKSEDSN